jgi:transposase-like protein
MMQFPLDSLLDKQVCYSFWLHIFHPDGLACPHGHPLPPNQAPHDRHRAPILDYRCRTCGSVFNLFTNTLFSKTRYRCSTIVLILRGIAQGIPTKHLAAELDSDRGHLLSRRHDIQAVVARRLSPLSRLPDDVTEADELYQNAGEKGHKHTHVADPPRRRANKAGGHGTWENDRPPIAGVVGRSSSQLRLHVCHSSDRATLQPFVERHTRDDDGDGIREVHINTIEGIWTGVRNFLRPFRGVSKWFLDQYSAIFEWAHNLKRVTADFLRAMMIPFTSEPT